MSFLEDRETQMSNRQLFSLGQLDLVERSGGLQGELETNGPLSETQRVVAVRKPTVIHL